MFKAEDIGKMSPLDYNSAQRTIGAMLGETPSSDQDPNMAPKEVWIQHDVHGRKRERYYNEEGQEVVKNHNKDGTVEYRLAPKGYGFVSVGTGYADEDPNHPRNARSRKLDKDRPDIVFVDSSEIGKEKGNGKDEYQAQKKSLIDTFANKANVSDDLIARIVRGDTLTEQHDGQKPSANEVQNMAAAIAKINGIDKDTIRAGASLVMKPGTQAVHTASLGGKREIT